MAAAHRAGLAPSQFWAITPYQLGVILKAEATERQERRDMAAWSAWHGAAFGRCKKLPDLKDVLGAKPNPEDVGKRLKAVMKAAFPSKKRGII